MLILHFQMQSSDDNYLYLYYSKLTIFEATHPCRTFSSFVSTNLLPLISQGVDNFRTMEWQEIEYVRIGMPILLNLVH